MKNPPFRGLVAALLAGAVSGCAAYPYPAEELPRARAAVELTQSAAVPGADAAIAQRKLELARRFLDARDYGPARWLAEQAEVDAELALARSAAREALRALETRTTAASPLRRISHNSR